MSRAATLSIVYVWDADYPWDVRTEKICHALTNLGHRVTIVARNQRWLPESESLPEGAVRRMSPWRWAGRRLDGVLGFPAFFSPRWSKLIRTAAEETSADLLIVRDLPLGPTALSVGRQLGIPVILDMAENYPAMMRDRRLSTRSVAVDAFVRNPWAVDLIERYCVSKADHVLTVVEESSERLVRLGADPAKLTVVSNTPPRARAECSRGRRVSNSGEVTLVYLGLLETARGIGDLVRAIRILRDRGNTRVRATIIGDGRDAETFVASARDAGVLDTQITFTGRLSHSAALRAVSEADIGLLPHRATAAWNTTVPNKLFDYMAAGLPVVSSNAIPCERIVRETGCGELFLSSDATSLAEAICRAADPQALQRMGEAGRQAVRDTYNWERDIMSLFEAVTATVR